jgi:predicted dehydrogenase
LRRRFLRALLVTIEELCAESDVEAAYVATPPVSHP